MQYNNIKQQVNKCADDNAVLNRMEKRNGRLIHKPSNSVSETTVIDLASLKLSQPAVPGQASSTTTTTATVDAHYRDLIKENLKLKSDIATLQKQLVKVSAEQTHSNHLRATIQALQCQIKFLVEELHRAWNGQRRLASFETPNHQGDVTNKIQSFTNDFMNRLQMILQNAFQSVSAVQKQQPVELKHMEAPIRQVKSQVQKSVQHIPKRIANRPHRIRIPRVIVHNSRLQEIELMVDCSPMARSSLRQGGIQR
ncbi:hypothetical protein MP228_000028 [Amoeboaphelidium protococcarum]|nr:hypothetical protein MP228_000028 [Amoeboaphelidium protococcarum]